MMEILVVLAIIAVVFAILFPTLVRAKAKANETKCISNMRQSYLAVMLYRDDAGSQALYGSLEEMGLPDDPEARVKGIGQCPNSIFPPGVFSYHYYPIPAAEDLRNPTWSDYSIKYQESAILLDDRNHSEPIHGMEEVPPFARIDLAPMAMKYVRGITLGGNVVTRRGRGQMGMTWWHDPDSNEH